MCPTYVYICAESRNVEFIYFEFGYSEVAEFEFRYFEFIDVECVYSGLI